MSLLYHQKIFPVSKFALRSDCDENSDTVLISRTMWQLLAPGTHYSRICLCIGPLRGVPAAHDVHDHIVCWADLSEQSDVVAIPSSWPTTYGSIFGPDICPLQIALDIPVPLQEIVLTALSGHAYDLAKHSPASLETWFSNDQRILRCGTRYELDLHESHGLEAVVYHLESSTPALQGYVEAGFTNFVVMQAESNLSLLRPRHLSIDIDAFEIGEEFLANSMRRPPHITNPSLHCFLPIIHHAGLGEDNDDATLYVRTSDLIHLGVLDGDWLLASRFSCSKQKLVRVRADDHTVERTGSVMGSPVLLRNICVNQADPDKDTCPPWIVLQSSQLERIDIRCLPLAQCIKIACINSPLTESGTIQQLLLLRLKHFFETRPRLVQQGDIIAISLDTDEDHLAKQIDEVDDMVYYTFPSVKSRFNEVAFFHIISVVPEARTSGISNNLYLQYVNGELGCRVDTAITRVIQEGFERSHIPPYDQILGEWNNTGIMLNYDDSPAVPKVDDVCHKLTQIARVSLFQSSVKYNLRFSVLLEGPKGVGKYTAVSEVARQLGMHLMELNCYRLIGRTEAKAEALKIFEKASSCAPCILILRRIEAFSNIVEDTSIGWSTILEQCFEKVIQSWESSGKLVLIVGTTSEPAKLPISILSQFKHRVDYKVPSSRERRQLLNVLLTTTKLSLDVSLDDLANRTAALVSSDLVNFARHTKLSSLGRCIMSPYEAVRNPRDIILASVDFEKALEKTRTAYSEIIGAPTIPQVSWDDIGGLVAAKSDILDTIQLPLEHPEVFTDGLKKRSGILLYGPPGTGKTLIAKAVATTFSLSFLSVKGPELLDMYIGESEANVRKIFQRARDAAPCIIFFDELDSIAPKRGNHGDSGGVMDRIVSQLLAELDGAATTDVSVFVIGATNRPDLLDSALLRPGRFDKILYLGFSDTHDAQVQILRALTRKFRLDRNIDLLQIATKCRFSYSGADFYALCSDAMLAAMTRKADEVEKKISKLNQQQGCSGHPSPITPQYYLAEMATQEDIEVTVTEDDFDLALKNVIPSVSQVEMERYAEMRRKFVTVTT